MSVICKFGSTLSSSVRHLAARSFSMTSAVRRTFEPDYLDSAVPPIPTYPPLNIQIRGYDYCILESFQSYVHNLAENMGINVEEAWITPAKSYKISTFHEGGTRVKTEYSLNMYERNVQVVNLRSVDAPILLDTIRAALPEGVRLSVHNHEQEHYEARFIPDPFINSVRQELSEGNERLEAAKAEKEALAASKTARKQALILKSLEEDE